MTRDVDLRKSGHADCLCERRNALLKFAEHFVQRCNFSVQTLFPLFKKRDFGCNPLPFLPIVPSKNEVTGVDHVIAVIFLMTLASRFHMPIPRHREPTGSPKVFDGFAAQVAKPVGNLRLYPWQKTLPVTKDELIEEQPLIERPASLREHLLRYAVVGEALTLTEGRQAVLIDSVQLLILPAFYLLRST